MLRPIMELAYQDLANGRIPLVVAPTGYGKTRASPEIYHRARSDGLASGLIHVAPLRSLVQRIYEETFRSHGGAYQMHDPRPGPDKSPYLLRPLVVTTLDSFTLNMYRIPVLESLKIREGLSYGHYYPVYTSVLSSIIVFDEAHLYLSDEALDRGVTVDSLRALVEFLSKAGTSLMIETATMRPSTLSSLAAAIGASGREVVIRLPSCPRSPYEARLQETLTGIGEYGVNVERTMDEAWLEENSGIRWKTRVYKGWGRALAVAKRLSREGRVLIVANTVSKAVELYSRLGGDALLIHGRLTTWDQKRVVDQLGSNGPPSIIVSTQVIEAGVDVNSIAVIAEAAPIENLVQRAGRACRRGQALEWCRENDALVGIVVDGRDSGVYDRDEVEASLSALKSVLGQDREVDWRLPCPFKSRESYTSLIAEADLLSTNTNPPARGSRGTIHSLLSYFLEKDGVPDFIEEVKKLAGWCGLVRNTIIMPIAIGGDYVITSLQWALTHAKQILELDLETGAPILVGIPLVDDVPEARGPAINTWRTYRSAKGMLHDRDCYRLLASLASDERMVAKRSGAKVTVYRWALSGRPGSYEQGIGLIADLDQEG